MISSSNSLKAVALLGLTAALVWPHAAQAADPSASVTLLTLDGHQHRGPVESLTPESIRMSVASASRTFAVDDIHWLRFSSSQSSLADEGLGSVELSGGSLLPVTAVALEDADLAVTMAAPLSSRGRQVLRVPFEQVTSIVFHRGSPSLQEQWRRICRAEVTADLIVVKRRNGDTLDFVEGIVTAISDKSISVDLDGEQVDVDRTRVYGLVCFRPQADSGQSLTRVLTQQQGELHASQVSLVDGRLVADLPVGEEISVPIDAVEAIDYSRGGVQSLSDLEPVTADWRPYFQPPGDLNLLREWGLVRRDVAYNGEPITLREQNGELQRFAKGLAIRSHGEVVYAAPAGFSWFRATVGLDPAPRVRSDVELRILADGRPVLVRRVATGDSPFELELPIAGVGAITLVVDYGGNVDVGDNLHFGNARFTK